MSDSKVAIITGGASGLGRAVAESFAQEGWRVHVFDLNVPAINEEAPEAILHNCVFHKVDVTSWNSLSSSFDAIFRAESRLDFVFANAGVMERGLFFKRHDPSSPPPEPGDICIDVNLKGVINTSYLAQHYFRAGASGDKDCVLIMTSSIAGLYPQSITPFYAASKAGILNFMRSVAPIFYEQDGIRTYAICPGSVRTHLLPKEAWDAFPEKYLTKIENVTSTIESLVNGTKFEDSWGQKFEKSTVGLAVEIFVDSVYFRGPPHPCNDAMGSVLKYMHPGKKEDDRDEKDV